MAMPNAPPALRALAAAIGQAALPSPANTLHSVPSTSGGDGGGGVGGGAVGGAEGDGFGGYPTICAWAKPGANGRRRGGEGGGGMGGANAIAAASIATTSLTDGVGEGGGGGDCASSVAATHPNPRPSAARHRPLLFASPDPDLFASPDPDLFPSPEPAVLFASAERWATELLFSLYLLPALRTPEVRSEIDSSCVRI